MYSKVIVPLDGSDLAEQALPYAELVAKSLSVPVELVQAYDILPLRLLGAPGNQVIEQLDSGARQRAVASMEPAQQRLQSGGLAVRLTAQRGLAADIIVAQAGIDPEALVVMSTHGRGGISRWVMGSVTDKVVHTIPNSMLIVRASAGGPASPETTVQSVVAPLDGSALSELALPHAIGLASALSAGIRVLRVTPTVENYRRELMGATAEMGALVDLELDSAEELVAKDAEEVAAYLADVSARIAIDHAHGVTTEHVTSGNIAQTIIDQASAPASLVVMTTHGRSGVGRMVLGSVTDRVIRHSNVPALVIR